MCLINDAMVPDTWHLLHFLQQRCNEASEERRTKTDGRREVVKSSESAKLETWTLLASNEDQRSSD